jgi:hypothetical protein
MQNDVQHNFACPHVHVFRQGAGRQGILSRQAESMEFNLLYSSLNICILSYCRKISQESPWPGIAPQVGDEKRALPV